MCELPCVGDLTINQGKGGKMIYQKYLYKAYLFQCLFAGIEDMIDQDILSENEFKTMLLDRKSLSWYNLEKIRQGDRKNGSS